MGDDSSAIALHRIIPIAGRQPEAPAPAPTNDLEHTATHPTSRTARATRTTRTARTARRISTAGTVGTDLKRPWLARPEMKMRVSRGIRKIRISEGTDLVEID